MKHDLEYWRRRALQGEAKLSVAQERITELEALTEADGKEIGSYEDGTGLRGECRKDSERITELEAANWHRMFMRSEDKIEQQWRRQNELEAEIERLRGALKLYGSHDTKCRWDTRYGRRCTCGYTDRLTEGGDDE